MMTHFEIADELIKTWPAKVDPGRLDAACRLLVAGAVKRSPLSTDNRSITPTYDLLTTWYDGGPHFFGRGTCTCPDHLAGNVCCHRLAWYILHRLIEERKKDKND